MLDTLGFYTMRFESSITWIALATFAHFRYELPSSGETYTERRPGSASLVKDQPVLRPRTNQPKARVPKAKIVSPIIRNQRKVFIVSVCRNSAERAYHKPCSTLAQVCSNPIGRRLRIAINNSPTFIAQKANVRAPVFHTRCSVSPLRQNSISP